REIEMSETTNPLLNPEQAAHEVVLEMARAGKFTYPRNATEAFTHLLDHYRSELKRVLEEDKAQ
ncbi:TPA: hypothetical protein ACPZLO_004524, partial [Yersinia enterocolitica]